ncbi:MAG: hypothetical protein IJW43_06265 [Clostridia bacterium]|nr:hypothetical protein [Clostridia bacterium]
MTSQERFDVAEKRYANCIKFIDAMSKHIQKARPDFKEDIAKGEFDIILQYILLRTALADGKFKAVEGEFIDKIVDNYEILKLYGDKLKEGTTWQWIGEKADLTLIKGVVNELRPKAEKFMDDFINWFSALDLDDKEFDLLAILKNEVDAICENFLYCDGESDEEEKWTALQTVAEVLAVPWKLKMAGFEEAKK